MPTTPRIHTIIRGIDRHDWNANLTRPAGAPFYASTSNGLFVCLLLGAILLRRRRRAPMRAQRSRNWFIAAAIAYGGCLAAFAAAHGSRGLFEAGYVLLYEFAVAALLVAASIETRSSQLRQTTIRLPSRLRHLPVILLLLITATLCFYRLSAIPARIHPEEVSIGLWTRYCATGRVPDLFAPGYFDNLVLHLDIDAILLKVLGDTLWGLRAASVFVLLGTVYLTYRLAMLLTDRKLASFAAATFVAFHHAAFFYGRNGIHIIDPLLVVTAAAFFAARALMRRDMGDALRSGLVAGIGAQGYAPVRIGAVIALLLFLLEWVKPHALTRRGVFRLLFGFLLGIIIALGPILLLAATRPEAAASRERLVLSVTPSQLVTEPVVASRRLLQGVRRTLWLHTFGKDNDPHYGSSLPFIPTILIPGLLVGLLSLGLRHNRFSGRLIMVWILATLSLGSVIVSVPRIRRTLAIVPALGLLYALSLAKRRGGRWLAAATLLLLGIGSFLQVRYVLLLHPRERPPGLYATLGRILASSPAQAASLMTLPDLSTANDYVLYLSPNSNATNVRLPSDLQPGRILLSATHAALLPALLRLPGARLLTTPAPPAAWKPADRIMDPDVSRSIPPARLLLTEESLAHPIGRIRLIGSDGKVLRSERVPLFFLDKRRTDFVRAARVQMIMPISNERPCRLSVKIYSRHATARMRIDSTPVAGRKPFALGIGDHRLIVFFRLNRGSESLMVIPTFLPPQESGP